MSHDHDHGHGHGHEHRKRRRKRFKDTGAGALADYKLLELLRLRIIPRRGAKPRARALIARFGDFADTLGVTVHVHLVIGRHGAASLRQPGLIEARAYAARLRPSRLSTTATRPSTRRLRSS